MSSIYLSGNVMEYTQGGKVCQQLNCVNEETGGSLPMTAVLLSNLLLSVDKATSALRGKKVDLRGIIVLNTQKWKLKCRFGHVHFICLPYAVL